MVNQPNTINTTDENLEPSNKKIKSGPDFSDIIIECYDLKFNVHIRTKEQDETMVNHIRTIRETLELTVSSSEISFGTTRVLAKINWGKCLSLLLEEGLQCIKALVVLTGKLNPGGGLL